MKTLLLLLVHTFRFLACKHDWDKSKLDHGDKINYHNQRTEYKCLKCGLFKYSKLQKVSNK